MQGVGADGLVERRLAWIEPDPGLEPLPVAGDEADQRDGGIAQQGGEVDDIVEALLGGGIEDAVSVERGEALRLGDGFVFGLVNGSAPPLAPM